MDLESGGGGGGYDEPHQWISITVNLRNRQPEETARQDQELNLPGQEEGLIREKRTYYSDSLNFRDGKFHTVAVLWTPEFYQFFYDDELIGTLRQGVSQYPGYMILWPRHFDFQKLA